MEQKKQKELPVKHNEDELGPFPQVWLLLGIIGSSLLFASYLLAFFLPWFYSPSGLDDTAALIAATDSVHSFIQNNGFSGAVLLIGTLLMLLGSMVLSDVFRVAQNRRVLLAGAATLCAISAGGLLLSAPHQNAVLSFVLVFCFGAGITLLAILWSMCFSSIRRGVIGSFLATAFLVTGIIVFLVCLLQDIPRLIATAALPLLSAGIYFVINGKIIKENTYPPIVDSKKKYSLSKRSLYCTFITGLPLGVAAFFVTSNATPSSGVALVVGLGAIVGGALMVFDCKKLKTFTEQYFLQRFAAIVVLPFLLLPFIPTAGRLICSAYLVTVIGANTVMCFVSISEVTNFNKLAVFWAFGLSWLNYAMGFAFGWALLWAMQFSAQTDTAQMWALLGLGYLIVISGLIFKDNSIGDEPNSSETGAMVKSSSWKEKVRQVSELHELSPRQQEVLTMLARGRNASYLQEHFYISKSTAKAHIYNIYKKLEIHSQQELIDFIENIDEQKKSHP